VSWRCGLTPTTAREHVRVARWLIDKPLIQGAFAKGELSYSKVRALSRAEGVTQEEELLQMATYATASQLDRIVRGYRRSLALNGHAVHEKRYLSLTPDEDGSVVIRGRLPAEEAALLTKALSAARERCAQAHPAEDRAHRRTADNVEAISEMADSFLAGLEAGDAGQVRTGGDRVQVALHVDAESLTADEAVDRCETDDGTAVAPETARRLSCDASVVALVERGGQAVSVGRKTRTIPPALRRALRARDVGCRFPGCTSHHRVDAHHVQHWARGGRTDLANLVQLCRYHHRLVHEGGFGLERRGDSLIFTTPLGQPITRVPRTRGGNCAELVRANERLGTAPGPETCLPKWAGESYDFNMAVDALWAWRGPPAEPAVPG
jgi:Domain of unknown function (DUF222)/HNH endonuclease